MQGAGLERKEPRAGKVRLQAGPSAKLRPEGLPPWASLGRTLEPGSGDGHADRQRLWKEIQMDRSDIQGTPPAATWPPREVFLASAKDQPAPETAALWAQCWAARAGPRGGPTSLAGLGWAGRLCTSELDPGAPLASQDAWHRNEGIGGVGTSPGKTLGPSANGQEAVTIAIQGIPRPHFVALLELSPS